MGAGAAELICAGTVIEAELGVGVVTLKVLLEEGATTHFWGSTDAVSLEAFNCCNL